MPSRGGVEMAASLLVVVGHCTSTTARVMVCTRVKRTAARIAWREDGGTVKSLDLSLTEAAPYRMGVFDLTGLAAGARIEYAVETADSAASLPAADALLG